MFLVNSRLGFFSAARSREHPFSRSYGVILPSSLTTLLPLACGFSPRPPVSVCGTGYIRLIAAFLDSLASQASLLYFGRRRVSPLTKGICLLCLTLRLAGFCLSPVLLASCVPTVLAHIGTGISTCCPSTTTFVLALGPDLPRED